MCPQLRIEHSVFGEHRKAQVQVKFHRYSCGPGEIWLGKRLIAVNFNQRPLTQKYSRDRINRLCHIDLNVT